MSCKEYKDDKSLKTKRIKELGSLEYQCRTCRKTNCHFLKVAKTHFEACFDFERKMK